MDIFVDHKKIEELKRNKKSDEYTALKRSTIVFQVDEDNL